MCCRLLKSDFHERNSVQDEHPASTASAAEQQTSPSGAESPVAPPKTVVPRTSSRNAYSQQRQSILKKQQQQALKAGKKQDTNGRTSGTKNFLFSEEDSSKVSVLVKNVRVTDGTHAFTNDENSDQRRGIKSREETNYSAKKGAN